MEYYLNSNILFGEFVLRVKSLVNLIIDLYVDAAPIVSIKSQNDMANYESTCSII